MTTREQIDRLEEREVVLRADLSEALGRVASLEAQLQKIADQLYTLRLLRDAEQIEQITES